jgi:hypothetical protein
VGADYTLGLKGKDHSAHNFSVVRKIALYILKNLPIKMNLAHKRRKCSYGPDFLLISSFLLSDPFMRLPWVFAQSEFRQD